MDLLSQLTQISDPQIISFNGDTKGKMSKLSEKVKLIKPPSSPPLTLHKVVGVLIEPTVLRSLLHLEDDTVLVRVLLPVEGLEVLSDVVAVSSVHLVVKLGELAWQDHRSL